MLLNQTVANSLLKKISITVLTILGLFTLTHTTPAIAGEKAIDYRLKWLINSSVAGDIYAENYGYFKRTGLKVNVKAGGPERDAIRELELGHAQFGVASADQVIRATAKGASIIVLAQLFQSNPLQWIYRADDMKLNSLNSLKGKKVGITYGGNDETIMKALLAKGNIAENQLTLSSVRFDYTPFFRKKVDIWPVYRNTQGVFLTKKLEKAGESVGFFNPSDYGIQFVANSVVTTEKMIKTNPELVKKFITALLLGWEDSLNKENINNTISAIAKYDKDSSRETIIEQLSITREMVKPSPNHPIGKIDTEAWKQTEEIMLDQKLIQAPVHIERRLQR